MPTSFPPPPNPSRGRHRRGHHGRGHRRPSHQRRCTHHPARRARPQTMRPPTATPLSSAGLARACPVPAARRHGPRAHRRAAHPRQHRRQPVPTRRRRLDHRGHHRRTRSQAGALGKPSNGMPAADAIFSATTRGIPWPSRAEGRSRGSAAVSRARISTTRRGYLYLLELIPTADTDPEVLETVRAFGDRVLGKGIVSRMTCPALSATASAFIRFSKQRASWRKWGYPPTSPTR